MTVSEGDADRSFAAFFGVLRARGPTLNMLFEQARVAPEGDVLRDACAGAIAVVLHDALRGFWRSRKGSKQDWRRLGTSVAGYSVPQIFAACDDNFRRRMRSPAVRVITAVLDMPVKKSAKHRSLPNVCWRVLERLAGDAGYARVESLVREFATALDEKKFQR